MRVYPINDDGATAVELTAEEVDHLSFLLTVEIDWTKVLPHQLDTLHILTNELNAQTRKRLGLAPVNLPGES